MSGAELTETFGRLFAEHAGALHRYLARRVGPTVADDLVADTFLVALCRRTAYAPARGVVRAWLYGIAANLLRHHLRAELRALRAMARLAARSTVDTGHVEVAVARADAARWTRRQAAAMATLSPGDREVLLLVGYDGLSTTEAAEALRVPPATIRTRLHRARRRLRMAG